jgi:hypothetical protein
MRNEKRNIDQKTGGRPKILSKIWETGRKKGCPHRCHYVSTILLHGDLDTPPQVSQVSIYLFPKELDPYSDSEARTLAGFNKRYWKSSYF